MAFLLYTLNIKIIQSRPGGHEGRKGRTDMTSLNTIYNLIKKERQELSYKTNIYAIEAHKRMIDRLVKEYKERGGKRKV